MNAQNKDTGSLQSLNLSVQLLSTINTNQTNLLQQPKSITNINHLNNRLSQLNKKFQHKKERTETTLQWIKQQGVNLKNITEIIIEDRKQRKQKPTQPVAKSNWQQIQQKEFQQLSFNDFIFKNEERIAYRAIMQALGKSQNRIDHMKQLRKQNLKMFNGQKNHQESKTHSKDGLQNIQQLYVTLIIKSLTNEGLNLSKLAQESRQMYKAYRPQEQKLFGMISSKQKVDGNREQMLKSSQKRTFDYLRDNKIKIIEECLIYGDYKSLISTYSNFQQNNGCQITQLHLFIHLFIYLASDINKANIKQQIQRDMIIKMSYFVQKLKQNSSKHYQEYYSVLLQMLLNYQYRYSENIHLLVNKICSIITFSYENYTSLDESVLDCYSKKMEGLLYCIISKLSITSQEHHLLVAQECKKYITFGQYNQHSSDIEINNFYRLFKHTLTKYILTSFIRQQQQASRSKNAHSKLTENNHALLQSCLSLLKENIREEDDFLVTFLQRYRELRQLVKDNRKDELKKNQKTYEFIRHNYYDFMTYLHQLSQDYHSNYMEILVCYYQQLIAMYYIVYLASNNLTKLKQLEKEVSKELNGLLLEYPSLNSMRLAKLLSKLAQ